MMADDDHDLTRFVDAQNPVFDRVLGELSHGRKTTHWMWFVFPQLRGLGHSAMALRYGVADLDEARRYLAHPVLGPRLREAVTALLAHAGTPIAAVLGSPDDLKLRSCLTLFREAAPPASADRTLFDRGLAAFHGGEPDARTLALLAR